MRFVVWLPIVLCLLLSWPTSSVAATQPTSAEKAISRLSVKAIHLLTNDKATDAQRQSGFRQLLRDHFDVPQIARFVLGTHWAKATPKQRAEYMKLFESYVVLTYSQRFKNYSDEGVEVTGSRALGKRFTLVNSVIKSPASNTAVKVDWRVAAAAPHRISDVVIEGVSMSVSQRSEFASIIQRGGGDIQVLIDTLRDKVKSLQQPED